MRAEGTISDILAEFSEMRAKSEAAKKLESKVLGKDMVRGLRAGLACWVFAIVVALLTLLYNSLFEDGNIISSPLVEYALYFGLGLGGLGLIFMIFGNSIFDSSDEIPDGELLDLDQQNVNRCRVFLEGLQKHVPENAKVAFSLLDGAMSLVSSEGRVKDYERLSVLFSSPLKAKVLADFSVTFRMKQVQETNALVKKLGRTVVQSLILLLQPARGHRTFADKMAGRPAKRGLPIRWVPTGFYEFHTSSVFKARLVSERYAGQEKSSKSLETILKEKLQAAFPDAESETTVVGNVVLLSLTFQPMSHEAGPFPPDWDAQHDIERLVELADILASSQLMVDEKETL